MEKETILICLSSISTCHLLAYVSFSQLFYTQKTQFSQVIGSLRNLAQLLVLLPETEDIRIFRKKGEAMLTQRQNFTSPQKDIFSHLLAEDSESGTKFTQKELNSNAVLVIVAGTDTTVSILIQAVKKLAKSPHIYRKLQDEIDGLYTRGQSITVESVRNLEYLNAVVNEALRLYTPTPSGTYATTQPQGLDVDGVHIPGNVQVDIPFLALMRDERYFPQGDEFIPERWTSERPDLLKDRRAFIPFGYGVHGVCFSSSYAFPSSTPRSSRSISPNLLY
jgi:cytochrome P450